MAMAARLVREARRNQKMTQAALAKASGVSASIISAIESGQRDPRSRTLNKILAALGLELSAAPSTPDRQLENRAAEFAQALRLAAALPQDKPASPRFPRLSDFPAT